MDGDKSANKAQYLYEEIWRWIEWQPEDQKRGFDVIKSHSRIEVIKPPARAALDITVEAPDQFIVRVPHESPKIMNERELHNAVKRWLGFAAYPCRASARQRHLMRDAFFLADRASLRMLLWNGPEADVSQR